MPSKYLAHGSYAPVERMAVIPEFVILEGNKRYAFLNMNPGNINLMAAIVKNRKDPYASLVNSVLDFAGDEALKLYLHAKTRRKNESILSSSLDLRSGEMAPTEAITGLVFSLVGEKKVVIERKHLKSRKDSEEVLSDESGFKLNDIDFTEMAGIEYTHRADCREDASSSIKYNFRKFEEEAPFIHTGNNDSIYVARYSDPLGCSQEIAFRPIPVYKSIKPIIEKSILDEKVRTFSLRDAVARRFKPRNAGFDDISALYEVLRRSNVDIQAISIYVGEMMADENAGLRNINRATMTLKSRDERQTLESDWGIALALSLFGDKEIGMKTSVHTPDPNDIPYIN